MTRTVNGTGQRRDAALVDVVVDGLGLRAQPPPRREVYAFWVNQDVVVPPAAFLGAVRGAAASPLNRRLLAG